MPISKNSVFFIEFWYQIPNFHGILCFEIIDNKIYNNNKDVVYGWHGIEYVYGGYIKVEGNKIKYQISFENKCVTKDFNTKYIISDGKCEDN